MSMVHDLSDDGLMLTSEGVMPDNSVYKVSIGWDGVQNRDSFVFDAKIAAEQMYKTVLDKFDGSLVPISTSFKRLGTFFGVETVFMTSYGGKPWKLPKFWFRKNIEYGFSVTFGWLFRSFRFSFRKVAG